MEVGVPSTDATDTVLAEQDGCVNIVQDVPGEARHLLDQFACNGGMS